MEYFLIQTDTIEALEENVNEYIKKGYVPLGGPSLSMDRNSKFKVSVARLYIQALTRTKKKVLKKK